MNSHLFEALVLSYEAQRKEALAALNIYINNSVGVGDHSNHLDELKRWTAKLTEAEGSISAIKRNFVVDKSDQ